MKKCNRIMKFLISLFGLAVIFVLTACSQNNTPVSIEITGEQPQIYMPEAGDISKSKPFIAVSYDKKGNIIENSSVVWSLSGDCNGASIDANGVVTITDKFFVADINGQDLIIVATSSVDSSVTQTTKLHVNDVLKVTAFDLKGADVIMNGVPEKYEIYKLRDQYSNIIDATGFEISLVSNNNDLLIDGLTVTAQISNSSELKATLTATIGGLVVNKDIRISDKDLPAMGIDGSSTVAKLYGKALKIDYEAYHTTTKGETFTWSLEKPYDGVTIDKNGILTVSDSAPIGTLVICCSGNISKDTATKTVAIKDFAEIKSFNIVGAPFVDLNSKASFSVANVTDEYGNIVDMEAVFSTDTNLAKITSDGILTVGSNTGYFDVSATLGNPDKKLTLTMPVKIEPFSFKDTSLTGKTSLSVDVTKLANYSENTEYQITLVYSDKHYEVTTQKADNGIIKLTFENASAVEVSPIFKYALGKNTKKVTDGYTKVANTEVYDISKYYGFSEMVVNTTNGVFLNDAKSCFIAALPDGYYDIMINKASTTRASIYVNGGIIGANVDAGGSGRKGTNGGYSYKALDVVVKGGTARISMANNYALGNVEFRKVSTLIPRKTHVYIGGDSTICNYYPLFLEEEPVSGTIQTGWGQVFEKYLTDEMVVDNYGAGGTFAKSWYGMAFNGVLNNAQPGDYFILQEGINDRTYSSIDEMIDYITLMVDKCLEKGIIPVLATSQQSCKFWKSSDGTDLGEFEKPEGSGLAAFAVAIRNLAKEKNILFIDNALLTSEWFGVVGKTYVGQNYHMYDKATDVINDSLHLSYAGSMKVAELAATSIAEQIKAGSKDLMGNTFDGIRLNPIVSYDVEHKDSTGAIVKTTVNTVQAK